MWSRIVSIEWQNPRSLGMGMVFYENAIDPDLKALGLFCSFTTITSDTKTIHTHTYKDQSSVVKRWEVSKSNLEPRRGQGHKCNRGIANASPSGEGL